MAEWDGDPGVQAARQLNPEAGDHRVTTDAAALAAVAQAGVRCRERFPYVEARYGARGQAFTTSDGAWLVLVGRDPPAQVRPRLAWLCGLLAARGLPRVVLETYLCDLAEALGGAGEAWAGAAAQLGEAGAWLAGQRTAAVPPAEAAALEAALARGGPPPTPDAAALLVAAVADGRCGLPLSVPRLAGWLLEPARCAPAFRAAAEAALLAAGAGG